jgi:ADP-ribose pyrophosphatase YjhB (NUDIX family)
MKTKKVKNRDKPFYVACYLVLLKNNKVLLLRRYNTGYEDGNYGLISGHVESNESIRSAIVREAKEEVGIEVNPNDLSFIRVVHRKFTEDRIYIDFFFSTKCWTGQPSNLEPLKCDEILWVDIENIPDNVIPYVRDAIEGMANKYKSHYCEVGW